MTNIYIFAIGFLVVIYIGLALFLTYTAKKFFLKEPEDKIGKNYKLILRTSSKKSEKEKEGKRKKAA